MAVYGTTVEYESVPWQAYGNLDKYDESFYGCALYGRRLVTSLCEWAFLYDSFPFFLGKFPAS